VEPYAPPVGEIEVSSTLVVDGFINASTNIATVKLTTARALAESGATQTITDADVWIEDEFSLKINLIQKTPGVYESVDAVFAVHNKYRLHIARDGKKYNSDLVEVTRTPPIDSVTWEADDLDVVMRVSSHDPANEASYFKWDFLETYEYSAPYDAKMIAVPGSLPVNRPRDQSIYVCWQTDASQNILTTSIDQLGDKVVYRFPIHRLKGDDIKLWRLYTILVKQQCLSKEAYSYWSQLKRTNENLGGLFDPMPSEVTGNIHSSNKEELVLGFFYGSEVTEKRMFIAFYDLPDNILHLKRIKECLWWQITPAQATNVERDVYVLGEITDFFGNVVAYAVSTASCSDCRRYRKGGVLTRPEFWPPPL
jgi:hypothetical protein